jgi:hypothetical protein
VEGGNPLRINQKGSFQRHSRAGITTSDCFSFVLGFFFWLGQSLSSSESINLFICLEIAVSSGLLRVNQHTRLMAGAKQPQKEAKRRDVVADRLSLVPIRSPRRRQKELVATRQPNRQGEMQNPQKNGKQPTDRKSDTALREKTLQTKK